jgi:hypothetical protein
MDYGAVIGCNPMPDVTKDPDDVVDLEFNWVVFLESFDTADSIDSSSFLLPDGLTEDSTSNTTLRARIWLSGGSAGQMYRVTNRIVTDGGRTKDMTQYVLVREE